MSCGRKGTPAAISCSSADTRRWLRDSQARTSSAVAQAFEKKPRPPVVWLHFQECTCCSESFIRSSHPIVADVLLDLISLDYTETLQAAAGFQAEKCLHDTIKNDAGKYILLVEGSVPVKGDGVYCTHRGQTAEDILQESGQRCGGGHRLGQLRVQRLHSGGEPQSHRRDAHPQADQQAGHQRPRLPTDCRRDDRRGHAHSGAGPRA